MTGCVSNKILGTSSAALRNAKMWWCSLLIFFFNDPKIWESCIHKAHGKCSQMFISSQNKISEEEIWGGAKWTDDTNIWWYQFPKVGSYLHCQLK